MRETKIFLSYATLRRCYHSRCKKFYKFYFLFYFILVFHSFFRYQKKKFSTFTIQLYMVFHFENISTKKIQIQNRWHFEKRHFHTDFLVVKRWCYGNYLFLGPHKHNFLFRPTWIKYNGESFSWYCCWLFLYFIEHMELVSRM